MKYKLLIALMLISCGIFAADDAFDKSTADPEVKAAITKAQERIGSFWKHYKNPGREEKDFMLKVRIGDSNGVEHFWCGNIRVENGIVYGELWNHPGIVRNVKYGDQVKIDPGSISDWIYYRDGRIIGGYTIRVMLKYLDEAERKRYESIMGPEE